MNSPQYIYFFSRVLSALLQASVYLCLPLFTCVYLFWRLRPCQVKCLKHVQPVGTKTRCSVWCRARPHLRSARTECGDLTR